MYIDIMNKYKVQITKTYTLDILANDTQEAENLASTHLESLMTNGVEHYYEGETQFETFNVNDTDDGADEYFNPLNK